MRVTKIIPRGSDFALTKLNPCSDKIRSFLYLKKITKLIYAGKYLL
ncbi:hypothetical protein TPE_0808 [Treponema pedis str. T A4]|uniref:Uncharacterized protein n=1 Tax=Treponema pedis str. T A4 TaxID=1291379 RepID=S6A868_9SPIR|nr:hypothetical protein TPE_0808 [Treponema pedis str. T A4]